jgi:hypothetical protein
MCSVISLYSFAVIKVALDHNVLLFVSYTTCVTEGVSTSSALVQIMQISYGSVYYIYFYD